MGFSAQNGAVCERVPDFWLCVCFWRRFGEDSETGSGGAHLCHALQLRPHQPILHPAETHTDAPHERLLFLPGESTKVLWWRMCCYMNNYTYYIKGVFVQVVSDSSEQFLFLYGPNFFSYFQETLILDAINHLTALVINKCNVNVRCMCLTCKE